MDVHDLMDRMGETVDALPIPRDVTNVGFVACTFAGEYLIVEPAGHPYGVTAALPKDKRDFEASPSESLESCLHRVEQLTGRQVLSLFPIRTLWITQHSSTYYFAGLVQPGGAPPAAKGDRVAWCSYEDARSRIAASKSPGSRQRDLSVLEVVSPMCLSPYRRMLLMVQALHQMGFQRLRAECGLSASGCYWRCHPGPVTTFQKRHGGRVSVPARQEFEKLVGRPPDSYSYSSAMGQDPFGWVDARFDTPKELAAKYLTRAREVAFAGYGPDLDYSAWLKAVLDASGPHGVFLAYQEFGPDDHVVVDQSLGETRFPLPPPGEAFMDEP